MVRKNSFLWFLLLDLICSLVGTHGITYEDDDGRKAINIHLSFVCVENRALNTVDLLSLIRSTLLIKTC